MTTHVENRDVVVIGALREELVGPSNRGTEIDFLGNVSFESPASASGPWLEKGSRQEILNKDRPTKRYGVAVLYPLGTQAADTDVAEPNNANIEVENGKAETESINENDGLALNLSQDATDDIQTIAGRSVGGESSNESDDQQITTTNTYKPSSSGLTFLANIPEGSELKVVASGGRYISKKVNIADHQRDWWVRRPWAQEAVCVATELYGSEAVSRSYQATPVDDSLNVCIEIYSRPYGKSPSTRMITVTLVNRTMVRGNSIDSSSLFQTTFSVSLFGAGAQILPYPEPTSRPLDKEEKAINLLYRNAQTFAIGHGCAADWNEDHTTLTATCFPVFEAPSVTPNVLRPDGTRLEVSMEVLAGLKKDDDGFEALNEVVLLYQQWVESLSKAIPTLPSEYREAAINHVNQCTECTNRMEDGIKFLRSDERALEAFRFANHSILLQQIRSLREPRRLQFDEALKRFTFSQPYPEVSYGPTTRGRWRAFQIAFLLLSIRSAVDGKAADRGVVELIWFPTGGGKTEAYLGLSAFSIFYRRLSNSEDAGVHVLMRYTLRLLTAQQFQRASGLIAAMEFLRRMNRDRLGDSSFSIGIWLGGATTPNTRDEAIQTYRSLSKGERWATNKFVISRCPWCGAQMGPQKGMNKAPAGISKCPGYERSGPTVIFKCTDHACDFSSGLPIYVIDEDIYEKRPTLVIGTVDKFAMLAWRPAARSIFGLNDLGQRDCSPPGLIIQDELHLISGPLGSVVGLYEGVIEELCTDRRNGIAISPKIVSSTATIRRYEEQVRGLYGRTRVTLFPPPGIDAGDSFFAKYETKIEGQPTSGRKYVGIHAPGLGSMQTVQVRTFAALLQAPISLDNKEEQDPWWTLLTFFNSLRELGTSLSLLQSDIPDYINALRSRYGLKHPDMRKLRHVMELTGRLHGDEVQDAIDSLDIPTQSGSSKPVDVCLASNIIEVGIDIDRLSLICIVGQPKTTSQYIQVTGRIGRRNDRPGVVVTLYGASKPRDRSHFERFRSYHERLYAQVEPTSVTPFSPPVLDRALHAVMAAYVRQIGTPETARSPTPFPDKSMSDLEAILLARVKLIDPQEENNFTKVFTLREQQWKRWKRLRWEGDASSENTPLLREAGAYAPQAVARVSWPTPMSMRNVDAGCEVEITQNYLNDNNDEE